MYVECDNAALRLDIADKIHKFLALEIKTEPKGGISEQEWNGLLREIDALDPASQALLRDVIQRALS